MPYKSNSDLPESVTKHLPSAAQTIFRKVFNRIMEKKAKPTSVQEVSAHKIAWAVVKKAGYKKDEATGMWALSSAVPYIVPDLRLSLQANHQNMNLRPFTPEDGLTPCAGCMYEYPGSILSDGAVIKPYCMALSMEVQDTDTCDLVSPIEAMVEDKGKVHTGVGLVHQMSMQCKKFSLTSDIMAYSAYRGSENGLMYFSLERYTVEELALANVGKVGESFIAPIDIKLKDGILRTGERYIEVEVASKDS